MSWWNRLRGGKATASSEERLRVVRPTMPGWIEEVGHGDKRVWRNTQGDVLSLDILPATSLRLPEFSDVTSLQRWSRSLAEDRQGGLIEVRVISGVPLRAVSLIYKRLQIPAYIFTGSLIVSCDVESYQVWMIVAGETGTTGVREAVVTTEMYNARKWTTTEEYKRSWRDPYDPTYHGVDSSVLRFVSDDEYYDEQFPEHPLSRVRRVLSVLPRSIRTNS